MAGNGGKRPGAGRKPGGQNRLKVDSPVELIAERINQLFAKNGAPTPLEFLISTFQDDTIDLPVRIKCAADAAPYIHRKQPADINHSGQVDVPTPIIIVQTVVHDDEE